MIIKIKIKTKAKEEKLITKGELWEAWVKEPPEQGKANAALIKLIKKTLGKDAKIIKGHKNRVKIISL